MSTRPQPRGGISKKVLFGGVAIVSVVAAALIGGFLLVSAGDDPNLATTAPDLPTPGATRTPTTAAAGAAVSPTTTAAANSLGAATPTTAAAAAATATTSAVSANTPVAAATSTPVPPPAPTATAVPAGPVTSKFLIDTTQSSSKFVITRTVLGSTAQIVATGSGVTGQFFVSEAGLSNAGTSSFQLDMRTVSSNDALTNSFLRSGEIDTTNYPFAQFVASSTSAFSPGYGTGNQFSFTLSGSLTLNGVTRPVTFQLLAKQSGEFFSATADADILLSSFDVQVPDTPLGGARDQIHVQVILIAHT